MVGTGQVSLSSFVLSRAGDVFLLFEAAALGNDVVVAAPSELRSDRLVLRRWREADRTPFALMNTDPEVMEYYPSTVTAADSDAMIRRIEETFAAEELGLWAVQVADGDPFIGYVGLWPARFTAPFTPAIEVGWRLAKAYWGRGYATEGARTAIADGFARLGLKEIVSFTPVINHRSRRVMEKLGMTHESGEDFDHPNVEVGHPLRRHALYRIKGRGEATLPSV